MVSKDRVIGQVAAAIIMIGTGIATGIIGNQYFPVWQPAVATEGTRPEETSNNSLSEIPGVEVGSQDIVETRSPSANLNSEKGVSGEFTEEDGLDGDFRFAPQKSREPKERPVSVIYLNLASVFPEGADKTEGLESYGGQLYYELSSKDSQWLSNVYRYIQMKPEKASQVLKGSKNNSKGKYNPSEAEQDPLKPETWTISKWKNIKISFKDGDGREISGYSNVKDIVSMASVYSYYKDYQDYTSFESYINQLWNKSHRFSVSMSNVYYCNGCLKPDDQYEADPVTGIPTALQESVTPGTEATMSSSATETLVIPETTAVTETSSAAPVVETTQDQSVSAANVVKTEAHNETNEILMFAEGEPSVDASMTLEGSSGSQVATETVAETSVTATDNTVPVETAPETQPAAEQTSVEETSAALETTQGESSGDVNTSTSESTTPNETTAAPAVKVTCPGHLDLNIQAVIIGLDEKRNLYSIDSVGNSKKNITVDGWQGWNESSQNYVTYLSSQDWNDYYGISITSSFIKNPLTSTEIDEYMSALPENLSDDRYQVIRYALESVGKVPYYYGGKPDASGYEDNNFGTVIKPDEKGRMLKGLDCSGWINWIYWSAIGNHMSAIGTDGLSSTGTGITRNQLQPGDIVVRLGENSHTVLFLGWAEDGKMLCVHETGGTTNNVTISKIVANWPYYRRLIP